jgi:hypothetical protein
MRLRESCGPGSALVGEETSSRAGSSVPLDARIYVEQFVALHDYRVPRTALLTTARSARGPRRRSAGSV